MKNSHYIFFVDSAYRIVYSILVFLEVESKCRLHSIDVKL